MEEKLRISDTRAGSLDRKVKELESRNAQTTKKLLSKSKELDQCKSTNKELQESLEKARESLGKFKARENNDEDLQRLLNLLYENYDRRLFKDESSLASIQFAQDNSEVRLKITIGLIMKNCPTAFKSGLIEAYFLMEDKVPHLDIAQVELSKRMSALTGKEYALTPIVKPSNKQLSAQNTKS